MYKPTAPRPAPSHAEVHEEEPTHKAEVTQPHTGNSFNSGFFFSFLFFTK